MFKKKQKVQIVGKLYGIYLPYKNNTVTIKEIFKNKDGIPINRYLVEENEIEWCENELKSV